MLTTIADVAATPAASADFAPPHVVLYILGAMFGAFLVSCAGYAGLAVMKKLFGKDKTPGAGITVTTERWIELQTKVSRIDGMEKELNILRNWRQAARQLVLKAQDDLREGKTERAMMALEFFRDLEDSHLAGTAIH